MKKRNVSRWILVGLSLVCACVVSYFCFVSNEAGDDARRSRRTSRRAGRQDVVKRVRQVMEGKVKAPPAPKKKRKFTEGLEKNMFPKMKPADQKIAAAVQMALDDEDFEGVRASVDKAMASSDPELRQHVIEALSWFGAAALPELTAFLSDADPETAEEAASQWQMALSDLEDDNLKVKIAVTASQVIVNRETLEMLMAEITSGDDELKNVQGLIDVILDGTPEAVMAAKESYEDLTGEKFTDVDAAEAWLKDNYDPEDDEAVVVGKPSGDGGEKGEEASVDEEDGKRDKEEEDAP